MRLFWGRGGGELRVPGGAAPGYLLIARRLYQQRLLPQRATHNHSRWVIGRLSTIARKVVLSVAVDGLSVRSDDSLGQDASPKEFSSRQAPLLLAATVLSEAQFGDGDGQDAFDEATGKASGSDDVVNADPTLTVEHCVHRLGHGAQPLLIATVHALRKWLGREPRLELRLKLPIQRYYCLLEPRTAMRSVAS